MTQTENETNVSAVGAIWAFEPYWLGSFGGQTRQPSYMGEFACDYETVAPDPDEDDESFEHECEECGDEATYRVHYRCFDPDPDDETGRSIGWSAPLSSFLCTHHRDDLVEDIDSIGVIEEYEL